MIKYVFPVVFTGLIGMTSLGVGLALQQRDRLAHSSGLRSGVTVKPAERLGPLSSDHLGFNLHSATDITRPGLVQLLKSTHTGMVRWPGGSESDLYHWRSHRFCGGWQPHPKSNFDTFMRSLVQPAGVKVAITLNYGTDETCEHGGDPEEAAAWVADAKAKGYRVSYWTVGNEVFGDWETDRHAQPHNPHVYAHEVAQGYYPQIKAADPKAKVGIVVNPYDVSNPMGWTRTVLQKARYDFVELHYYPLLDASTTDEDLLSKGISDFRKQVQALKQALGKRQTEILLGEFSNVPTRPNKQTVSVVNALYTGMLLAESAKLGVSSAFPWELQEDYCSHTSAKGLQPVANFSDALYGWQTFSTYSAFSIGLPSTGANCRSGVPNIPFGTPFPVARAAKLFGLFAQGKGDLLKTVVSPDFPKVRAYSSHRSQGFGLLLFNLDDAAAVQVPIYLEGQTQSRTVQVRTYGKRQYDESRFNRWVGPSHKKLGLLPPTFKLELPPWSMSWVELKD